MILYQEALLLVKIAVVVAAQTRSMALRKTQHLLVDTYCVAAVWQLRGSDTLAGARRVRRKAKLA